MSLGSGIFDKLPDIKQTDGRNMDIFMKLFARDLDKLIAEVKMYRREENLWLTDGGVKNSSGNLCLHIIGNLQHFIGAIIGETGYSRNREAEFSTTGVSRDSLLSSLLETKEIVIKSLRNFDRNKLQDNYPIDVFGEMMSYEYFIIHLIGHLNYHLGQINYLRRLTDI
jgi:uncharacterized damage-inducible protein DinB